MRAAPAFQITLRHFGVWRSVVCALALLGVASSVLWMWTRERPLAVWLWPACAVAIVVIAAVAVSLARLPEVRVRWDGLSWFIGFGNSQAVDMTAGDLRVLIDVGPWMLLRFTAASRAQPVAATWLPVQRLGIEDRWHALRCSLYSPRPAPAGAATSAEGA